VVAVERDPKQFQEICKRVVNLGNCLNDPTQLTYNDDKSFPSLKESMGDRYNFKVQVGDHTVCHRGFPLSEFRRLNGYTGEYEELVPDEFVEQDDIPDRSPDPTPKPTPSPSRSLPPGPATPPFFVPLLKGQDQYLFDYSGPEHTWEALKFCPRAADWDTLHGTELTKMYPARDSDSDSYEYTSEQDWKMTSDDYDSISDNEPVRLYFSLYNYYFILTTHFVYTGQWRIESGASKKDPACPLQREGASPRRSSVFGDKTAGPAK
jgi:hypothetical protein